VMAEKRNPQKAYPFIRAYCAHVGSYPYYLHDELEAARRTNAPADAYASKVGPADAQGPEDWNRVSELPTSAATLRMKLEFNAGTTAEAELYRFCEEKV
jgi:hypothetical protein